MQIFLCKPRFRVALISLSRLIYFVFLDLVSILLDNTDNFKKVFDIIYYYMLMGGGDKTMHKFSFGRHSSSSILQLASQSSKEI